MNNTTRILDCDSIDPDLGQPRKNKPIEYLRELGASIEAEGLNNAIHVRPNPDDSDRWIIVNGECRWTASVLRGLKTIESKIIFDDVDISDKAVFINQMVDNDVRKGLDPLETVQAYQTAIDMGASVDEIARKMGKKPGVIEADLPILKLPDFILREFDAGRVPKTVARKLAEFPEGKMNKAWEWAKTGKDADGMLKKIKAYQNQASQSSLFDAPDQKEKGEAKKAFGKLQRAIEEFAGSPYSNGKSPVVVRANSRHLDKLEMTIVTMQEIATQLKSNVKDFQAQTKAAVV